MVWGMVCELDGSGRGEDGRAKETIARIGRGKRSLKGSSRMLRKGCLKKDASERLFQKSYIWQFLLENLLQNI